MTIFRMLLAQSTRALSLKNRPKPLMKFNLSILGTMASETTMKPPIWNMFTATLTIMMMKARGNTMISTSRKAV